MQDVRVTLHRGESRFEVRLSNPEWRSRLERLPVADVLAQVEGIDGSGCRRLTLAAAPLDHPEWERIILGLRERGFRHFAVESDAVPLAAPDSARKLAELGVDWFFLFVGGIRRKVYETVLGEPDTFTVAMRGLTEALATSAAVYVVTPLVQWNVGDIQPLLEWLVQLKTKPTGFLLALPEVGRVSQASARALLPYAKQAAVAETAFRFCQGNRIEYGFFSKKGILPCASEGHLDRFATSLWESVQFMRQRKDDSLVRVPACETCSLEKTCKGADPAYVQQFGTGGMKPVTFEVSSGWKLRKQNSLEPRDFRHLSPLENDSVEDPRALVRINGHCNMSCSFCFIDRTVPDIDAQELIEDIQKLYDQGARHLILSGGEPTIHPDLPEIVSSARSMGYRFIELQSNGVRAADPGYARILKKAGVDEVCVSLHSANPEKSDEITRLPKAFWKTVQALHNLMDEGVSIKVAHVITELNYRELPETVRFLNSEFPPSKSSLSVCFGIAQPISDLVFSWVIPRFTEVQPFMQAALDYCMDVGIGYGGMVGEGGYPPCMLGGELKYYDKSMESVYVSKGSEERFYKAPKCGECSFDPYCPGVRRDYIDFYGDSEIKPFKAAVAVPEKRRNTPQVVTKDAALVKIGLAAASRGG